MNKYLIELIKLQNSVILPGFGALMIGNSKSGKIVFNAHLKFNDGALAKFITEKDGIDLQAAQNQVAKFVREIEAELSKGHSFDIFQFGKFTKKADGTIEFVQDAGAVIITEEAKKPAAEKAAPTKVTETKKPVEHKTETKPVVETPKETATPKTESLLDKLKSSESAAALESKKAEQEKELDKKLSIAEDTASKQIKNSFKPADEKTVESELNAIKKEDKPVEISKSIPLAEATKKDPAAQIKNSFKPTEEIKKETEKTVPAIEEKLVAASDPHKADPEKSADKKAIEPKNKKVEEKPIKESVKEKFKKDKPQKVKHENPEDKKPRSKNRLVKWFVFIIIICGGAIAGWFYKDQINTFLFAGVNDHDSDTTHAVTDHTHDTTAHVTEPIAEDTTTFEEPVETTTDVVEEPVVNHSSPGGTYHIIGNSFSSETNAANYVKKMNEKGYSAENLGKYNGLYLVSLKSFSSRDEAKNNLSTVKADASGAYVFKAN